jgi:hypothetical protein
MLASNGKTILSDVFYKAFVAQWELNACNGKRYGQAFYDHFNFYKAQNQKPLLRLYEARSQEDAQVIIDNLFVIQ